MLILQQQQTYSKLTGTFIAEMFPFFPVIEKTTKQEKQIKLPSQCAKIRQNCLQETIDDLSKISNQK